MKNKMTARQRPQRESRVLLFLSLYLLLFFTFVLAVSIFGWEAVLIGVFWELLMLPSLAMLVVVTGYALVRWFRTGDRATYLRVLLLLLAPWAIIIWLTLTSGS